MVYEYLPKVITHEEICAKEEDYCPHGIDNEAHPDLGSPVLTLVSFWSPRTLLRVCRFVQAEAADIFCKSVPESGQDDWGRPVWPTMNPQLIVHVHQRYPDKHPGLAFSHICRDRAANLEPAVALLKLALRFKYWAYAATSMTREEFMRCSLPRIDKEMGMTAQQIDRARRAGWMMSEQPTKDMQFNLAFNVTAAKKKTLRRHDSYTINTSTSLFPLYET